MSQPVSARGKRLAIVCLPPDWGHVQPLVLLGRVARDAGFDVRFYVAERCARLVAQAGFPAMVVPHEESGAIHALFRKLSRKSLFFLNFSAYSHANLFYSPQIYELAAEALEPLQRDLEAFDPTLIVADYYLLEPVYRTIASGRGVPLLVHNPSGTLAGRYRAYARAFGVSQTPAMVQSLVERAGKLHEFLFRRYFYLRHLDAYRRTKALQKRMRDEAARLFGPETPALAPQRIAVGLGWVERTVLGIEPAPDDSCHYFPPLPAPTQPLEDDIVAWIERDPRPVVYLSFGSMLSLPHSAYAGMVRALMAQKARVVWSISGEDADYVRTLVGDHPDFLLKSFVTQPRLLERPEVGCFVTHAGASSVQEALLGGAPMLCVPFYSDAPYIASVVERLGAGLRVAKERLGGPEFAAKLQRTLTDAGFKKRSAAIAAQLNAASSGAELRDFLLSAAAEGQPAEPAGGRSDR